MWPNPFSVMQIMIIISASALSTSTTITWASTPLPIPPEAVGPDLSEGPYAEYLLLSEQAQNPSTSNQKKIESLRRRLEKYPSAPNRLETLRHLAKLYLSTGQPKNAEPLLKELTGLHNDLKSLTSIQDRILLARTFLLLEKIHQALLTTKPIRTHLEPLVGNDFKLALIEVYLLESLAYRQNQNQTVALTTFEKAKQTFHQLGDKSQNLENLEYDIAHLEFSFSLDQCMNHAKNDRKTAEANYIQEINLMGICLLEIVEFYQSYLNKVSKLSSSAAPESKYAALWKIRNRDIQELVKSYDDRCAHPPLPLEKLSSDQARRYQNELSAQLKPNCSKNLLLAQQLRNKVEVKSNLKK